MLSPSLHTFAAIASATILCAISGVHTYWALGGRTGLAIAIPSTPVGAKPVFTPGRLATLAVAFALAFAAWLLLARVNLVPSPLSPPANRWTVIALAAIFALRTIGDFRYVGLFKRVRGTPFATADTRWYCPLCALLAAASAVVATG